MSRKRKIIIGNWKMNPASLKEAVKIFSGIKKISNRGKAEIIICPPYIYVNELKAKKLARGAQNVSAEIKPAHTGEISAEMLKKNGIDYVIIGHSERRAMGETDEIVNKKIEAALNENLKVILCIGESTRDEDGKYLNFIKSQLQHSLKRINRKHIRNILIAYEPLFFIGQKYFEAMAPHDIHQMVIFIRKHLIEHFNDKEAAKVPIIYGGSVSEDNASDIIKGGEIDGFLIGRQSLVPEQFGQIIKAAEKY